VLVGGREHRREAVFVGAGAGPAPAAIFATRAAPALKSGCLKTGSHSVIVGSLAARSWSLSPSRSQ
jgi:hypothetical protein